MGSLGYRHTAEAKRKIGLAKKGNPTRFRPGSTPWNKGTRGLVKPNTGQFRKGMRPWNKNTVGKMPVPWNKGKPHSAETIAKVLASSGYQHRRLVRGKDVWNWRGGVSSERKRVYHSKQYQAWRNAVFTRDQYTCVQCGTKGGTLHADHIMPYAIFSRVRFDLLNGRTLCIKCHRQTSTYANRLALIINRLSNVSR